MKLLFMNLKYSEKRCINPGFFAKSIKGSDNKPIVKNLEQMDIDEFSSILLDKMEYLLPKNNNFIQ